MRIAGAQGAIFTEKAIKEVYQKSGGIPRLINILCDNALLNGFALDQKTVDGRSIKEVAKDLRLVKGPRRIWIRLFSGIGVAIGILIFVHLYKSGFLLPLYNEVLRGAHYLKGVVMNEFQFLFQWTK